MFMYLCSIGECKNKIEKKIFDHALCWLPVLNCHCRYWDTQPNSPPPNVNGILDPPLHIAQQLLNFAEQNYIWYLTTSVNLRKVDRPQVDDLKQVVQW